MAGLTGGKNSLKLLSLAHIGFRDEAEARKPSAVASAAAVLSASAFWDVKGV